MSRFLSREPVAPSGDRTHGAVSDTTVSYSTVSDGTVSYSTVSDGTVSYSALSDGTVSRAITLPQAGFDSWAPAAILSIGILLLSLLLLGNYSLGMS